MIYVNLEESPKTKRINYEKRLLQRKANFSGLSLLAFVVVSTLISLCTFFLLQLLGLQNNRAVYNDFGGYDPNIYYLATILIYVVSLIVPIAIAFFTLKPDKNEVLSFKPTGGKIINGYLLIFGVAVSAVSNIYVNLAGIISANLGIDLSIPETPYSNNFFSALLFIISCAVLPAFLEELLFRGVILTAFRKYGDIFAIFISSVLFAVMHGSLLQVPFALCMGIALGFIRVKTDSLAIPMAVHFINNFISCILVIIEKNSSEFAYGIAFYLYLIMSIILGAVVVYAMTKYHREVFSLKRGNTLLSMSGMFKVVCASPLIIVAVLVNILVSTFA